MHEDLKAAIVSSRAAADAVLAGTLDAEIARAVAANNYVVVRAHQIDLMQRIGIVPMLTTQSDA